MTRRRTTTKETAAPAGAPPKVTTPAPELSVPWFTRPPNVAEVAAHAEAHPPGLWLISFPGHLGPEILRLYVCDETTWCGRNAAGTEHLAPLRDYPVSAARWLPLDGRGVPLATLLPETIPEKIRRARYAGDPRLHCSFCGKPPDPEQTLIAGPEVYICPECVGLCGDILAEREEPPEAAKAAPAGQASQQAPARGTCFDGIPVNERRTVHSCVPCGRGRSHQCTNLLYRLLLAGSAEDRSLVYGPAPLAELWPDLPAALRHHADEEITDLIRSAEAQGREDRVVAERDRERDGRWPLVIKVAGVAIYSETLATAPTDTYMTAEETARLDAAIYVGLTPGHLLRGVFLDFGPLGRAGLLHVYARTRIPLLFLVEEIGLLADGHTMFKNVRAAAAETLTRIGWSAPSSAPPLTSPDPSP